MRTVLTTLTVLMVLAIMGIGAPGSAYSEEPDTAVRLAVIADVKGFDPVISDDLYSNTAASQVYEGLTQYSYLERPFKVVPNLAEALPEVSEDGLVLTFKLKKSVRFMDDPCFKATGGKGRELVAEDFIYSWKRLADPRKHSSGWWIFENRIQGLDDFRNTAQAAEKTDYSVAVSGLQAPDKHTLVVTLTGPYPQFLYVLSMTFASAVPREAVETYDKEFLNHPVGTGPYLVKEWIRNSRIVFERNPNFRKEVYPSVGEPGDKEAGLLDDAGKVVPLTDRVEMHIVVEDQPRWLKLLKGQFDVGGIPKDNYDAAIDKETNTLKKRLARKGLILAKSVEPDATYTAFNMEDPILGKNALLRRAISLGYNTKRRINLFYNGRAIPAQTPIPPGLFGYDKTRVNPWARYDPEEAKKLLAEAGFPNGEGLPEFVYENMADSTSRQFGEMFTREMSRIGIKMKINANTWPEFSQKLRTKRAQIFGVAWSADYPDPENFLQLLYGPNESPSPNSANYKNPEYDKLYEQMKNMPDGPERLAVIDKMVKILWDDCPWIMGVHRQRFALQHSWMRNYKYHAIGKGFYKYYRVDAALRAEKRKKL